MQLLYLVSLIGFAAAAPQFLAAKEIVSRTTGEVTLDERDFNLNANGNIKGCVTGPLTGATYCVGGSLGFGVNGKSEDTDSNGNGIGPDGLDSNGCLVGPSGERVCPQGAFGSDGRTKVTFRGNQGPKHTGSNGNAGPVNAAGQPIDPAAETYRRQIEQYQRWAELQVRNAKRQLETA